MRTPLVKGDSIGPFLLRNELGAGAMGVVYQALDPNLRRDVALKLLKRSPQEASSEVTRFRIETWAASRLRHPNIVRIYTVGVDQGRHYYTMEYVPGQPLSSLLEKEALTLEAGVRLLVQIAHALAYAHTEGVLHRDVKPANILVDPAGRAQLTDFGLARLCDENLRLTESGELLGTLSYMSPEQVVAAATVGPASDQYALGAILYELMLGNPPFYRPGVIDCLNAILNEDPLPPRSVRPELPRNLEAICLTALARRPADRYADAAALADDLERWLAGEPVAARPPGRLSRLRRRLTRRAPLLLAGCTTIGAALLAHSPHPALHGSPVSAQRAAAAAPVTRLAIARTQIAAGQTHAALTALSLCLRQDPACTEALRLRARLQLSRGNGPGALADLDRLLQLGSPVPAQWRVRALIWSARLTEAATILQQMQGGQARARVASLLALARGQLRRAAHLAAEAGDAPLLRASQVLLDRGAGELRWDRPIPLLLRRARRARNSGAMDRAAVWSRLALLRDPSDARPLRLLARLAADRRQVAKAERRYRQLLRRAPGWRSIRLELARLLLDAGRPRSVARLLQSLDLPQSHHLSGLAQLAAGKGTAALRAFDRAVQAAPGQPENHRGRSSALQLLGRTAEAARALTRCKALMREAAKADARLQRAARQAGQRGRWSESIRLCSLLIRRDPSNAYAFYQRAGYRLRALRWHELGAALDDCARAVALDPDLRPRIDRDLSMMGLVLPRPVLMQKLEALSGTDPARLGILAYIYWRLAEPGAALRSCDASLARDPDGYLARMVRARLLLGAGQLLSAAADLELLRSSAPRNPEVWLLCAALAAVRQDGEATAHHLAQAFRLGLGPDSLEHARPMLRAVVDHPRVQAVLSTIRDH